jgi:hypothetical protein
MAPCRLALRRQRTSFSRHSNRSIFLRLLMDAGGPQCYTIPRRGYYFQGSITPKSLLTIWPTSGRKSFSGKSSSSTENTLRATVRLLGPGMVLSTRRIPFSVWYVNDGFTPVTPLRITKSTQEPMKNENVLRCALQIQSRLTWHSRS